MYQNLQIFDHFKFAVLTEYDAHDTLTPIKTYELYNLTKGITMKGE